MDRLIIHSDNPARPDLALTHDALSRAPEDSRVADIGALIPGRQGSGVRSDWIASLVGTTPGPGYVTLESSDGAFVATLRRAETTEAVLVHAEGTRLLTEADGASPAGRRGE